MKSCATGIGARLCLNAAKTRKVLDCGDGAQRSRRFRGGNRLSAAAEPSRGQTKAVTSQAPSPHSRTLVRV